MCEAIGVSRSGFCAWLSRLRSARSLTDEAIGSKEFQSFVASDSTYGARRGLPVDRGQLSAVADNVLDRQFHTTQNGGIRSVDTSVL